MVLGLAQSDGWLSISVYIKFLPPKEAHSSLCRVPKEKYKEPTLIRSLTVENKKKRTFL